MSRGTTKEGTLSTITKEEEITIPTLKIEWFRMPDHQMSKEMKAMMDMVRAKYRKMNDYFLSKFEKRYVVFIEDGVDLRKDLNLF